MTDRRLTIEEAKGRLRICHTAFYQRIKAGKLRTIKDGRRSFVLESELQRYENSLVAASQSAIAL